MTTYTREAVHFYSGPAAVAAGGDHPIHQLSVFRTPATTVKGAIVFSIANTFTSTVSPATIDSAGSSQTEKDAASFLADGWDVVIVALPVARDAGGTITGNDTSDVSFDISNWSAENNSYGDAYDGNGMIMPNTEAVSVDGAYVWTPAPFNIPAGYDGSVHPAQDAGRPDCIKAFTMATQYLKDNRTSLGWDDGLMGAYGRSGGANPVVWVKYGGERSTYHFPDGTGQDALTVRDFYDFIMVHQLQSWFDAFDASVVVPGFAKDPSVGGDAHYDEQAATISDGPIGQDDAFSLVSYVSGHDQLAENRAVPLFLSSGDQDADMGPPYSTSNTNTTTQVHNNFFAALIKDLISPNCELAFFSLSAQEVTDLAAEGIAYTLYTNETFLGARRVVFADEQYQAFIAPPTADVAGLQVEDFLPYPQWTNATAAVGTQLDRGRVSNKTDLLLQVSFNGVDQHAYLARGDTRQWVRSTLDGMDGVYLRGDGADPTAGSAYAEAYFG